MADALETALVDDLGLPFFATMGGTTGKLAAMKATIPLRKLAEPDDVANAVTFLLSDKAAMVSGTALPIDGGRSMGGHGL